MHFFLAVVVHLVRCVVVVVPTLDTHRLAQTIDGTAPAVVAVVFCFLWRGSGLTCLRWVRLPIVMGTCLGVVGM